MPEETPAKENQSPEANLTSQSPEADSKKAIKEEKVEDTATTVHVKLYSPYNVYYDDEAESISAENLTGPFDVLPRHHNFITLLSPCEVSIKSSTAGNKRIKISRGVMHVHNNKVTVFLDV